MKGKWESVSKHWNKSILIIPLPQSSIYFVPVPLKSHITCHYTCTVKIYLKAIEFNVSALFTLSLAK